MTHNEHPVRPRFILILSCTGGAGHLRAAEALHRTTPILDLPIRTETYDVLDFTSKIFKRLYAESYLQMVNRAPELWGYLYQHSERKPYTKKGLLKLFDDVNYRTYLARLKRLEPDAIICTHFLPYISVADRLRKSGVTAPVFAAITDFDVHQLWVNRIVERYFVYHEESAWQLQSKGIAADRILVKGIPVMPEFTTKQKQTDARRELRIDPMAFTVLLLSGGFGVGRVEEIVAHTAAVLANFPGRQFNLLVVCGKNAKAQKAVAALPMPTNVRPHIFGFVSNVHELMDAAEVLVSKSGGLTSSEAMAKQLPMIIVDPIPGQEARNADLIIEHGAGWKAVNLANLEYKLRRVIEVPELLTRARAAAGSLAKPNAAAEILTSVYRSLEEFDP